MPQGTLDLLILRTLRDGRLHGYGVAEQIQAATEDVLQIEEGSLYPALHRLERRQWVRGTWGQSDNNRRARFYTLTPRGRRELERVEATWRRRTAAIARLLR